MISQTASGAGGHLTEAQLERLEAAAESWKGTPFCEGTPVKGAGVSCHHVCAEIFFEAEMIVPRIPIPNGPSNWRGQHRSLIREWVETSGLFLTIAEGAAAKSHLAQPGDLLGFRVGALHHAMLQLARGRVVHSVVGHSVGIAPQIPSEWSRRLDAIWRLKSLA